MIVDVGRFATRTMSVVSVAGDARQRFVDAVRTRLDVRMASAGFPLNDVYDDQAAAPNRNTSVLYEGRVSDFLARYPGLDPVWDEEWRKNTEGCVDIWIRWSEADDAIESNLEHWEIPELAARYGDESSVTAVHEALQPGDIEKRTEVMHPSSRHPCVQPQPNDARPIRGGKPKHEVPISRTSRTARCRSASVGRCCTDW